MFQNNHQTIVASDMDSELEPYHVALKLLLAKNMISWLRIARKIQLLVAHLVSIKLAQKTQ